MKIIDKRQEQVTVYRELKQGDMFVFRGCSELRMKLSKDTYWNFVRANWFYTISDDDKVVPVNVELIIT